MPSNHVPKDWLPALTWPDFFYKQQREFVNSDGWQTWFIGGNGTGKTFIVYWSVDALMLGFHPWQHDQKTGEPIKERMPPIKVKCLVPSFDNVEDVALEKLLQPQKIMYRNPNKAQKIAVRSLIRSGVKDYGETMTPTGIESWIEVGPLLPLSQIKKHFSKEHKGLELKNGSSCWFSTSEQGWQAQRGGEQDILAIDEEGDERVTDESVRGLRNAKGGGRIIAGLTPPYQRGQGPTWTKEKVLEASLTDPEIHVVNACMADNPAITETFIRRFSKNKTKSQIDVQVYGKYPTWGDVIHPDFQNRLFDKDKMTGHILPNDTPMPEAFEVDWVMAFDWHQSKECAGVWGYVDTDGNVVFFDEIDKEWAFNKQISDLTDAFLTIEGAPHHNRRFQRWQDPSAKFKNNAIGTGFNAWDMFRKCGIITSAGKNRDPDVGIGIMNNYFRGNMSEHPRVFVYERMKYTRRYLENHYWKRNTDGVGKPDPKWSDYPICMRYILQELGWKHTQQSKKKWPLQSFKQPDGTRTVDVSNYM